MDVLGRPSENKATSVPFAERWLQLLRTRHKFSGTPACATAIKLTRPPRQIAPAAEVSEEKLPIRENRTQGPVLRRAPFTQMTHSLIVKQRPLDDRSAVALRSHCRALQLEAEVTYPAGLGFGCGGRGLGGLGLEESGTGFDISFPVPLREARRAPMGPHAISAPSRSCHTSLRKTRLEPSELGP